MKKPIWIILAVTLLLAAGAVVWLYLTDPEGAQEMVNGRLIPIAIVALTTVFSIFCTVYPLLQRASSVIDRSESSCRSFDEAAGGIQSGNAQNSERYRQLEAAISLLSERVESETRATEQNDRTLERILEMLRIGLVNQPELVRGGFAKEIARIASGELPKEDGEKEKEEAE